MEKISEIDEFIDNLCLSEELGMSGEMSSNFDFLPLGLDLKKLLVEVTGQKDIENIIRVKIKVVTSQAALHRLADYTPRLRVLILDGSRVDSLRDLGSSLKVLETLSVARCSLNSLDGLWGFRNLSILVASDNSISDISPCSGVRKLTTLDVTNNDIEDLSSFVFLQNCKHLRVLDIAGNRFDNYKDTILNLVPQIRVLDGEEIKAADISTKRRENPGDEDDPTSTDKDLIFFSEDEDKKVLAPIKKTEKDSSSSMMNYPLKPLPRACELGAGDEGSCVSCLKDDYAKRIVKDDREVVGKEKNLDSMSSSMYTRTHEFDTISMFDLGSNMGQSKLKEC